MDIDLGNVYPGTIKFNILLVQYNYLECIRVYERNAKVIIA